RKLRSALTALAIVLGVAMVSGTFVLTDTIQRGFDTIFTQALRNTDATVTAREAFKAGGAQSVASPSVPASVLARVRAVPSVQQAAGLIGDEAQLVGRDGKAIVHGRAPNIAVGIDPRYQRYSGLTLVTGAWARGPQQ